jgi:hypothetical protein
VRAAVDIAPHPTALADDEPGEQVIAGAKSEAPRARLAQIIEAAEAGAGLWSRWIHDQGMVSRQGRISISANRPAVT